MKTQNEIILQYLQEHGRITTFDAFRHGITRLSARIYDLRKEGKVITNERVNYKTKDGTHKHYDVYKLGDQS